MKHPGDYNAGGGGTGGPYLPTSTDSHQYTVMSYYSGPSYNGEPITPQLYDVAAVQYLYGVNSTTRAGNDTYTTSAAIKTIWDGGGVDTIDGRGYGGNQTIDLVAGQFSSVNGASKNLAIAYNVTIESAYGGGGNDTLKGNAAGNVLDGQAGNDTLDGGAGADTLIGGIGSDIYYIDNAGDVIVELAGQGTETAYAKVSASLADNVENLTLVAGAGAINGTGNAGANIIVGNESANRLTGNGGADRLTGNGGADVFAFADGDTGLSLAARDAITDFTIGQDLLNLIGIDADAGTAADDLFFFLGASAFSGAAGQLHYRYEAGRSTTVLEGDTNGDLLADFTLDLTGNFTLTKANFVAGSLRAPAALVLMGTPNADTLVGQGLNDTLVGLDGDDTLNGGGGLDELLGGDGNDTYVVNNAGVTVFENSGQGAADRIVTSISYTLGAEIEDLTLSGAGAINGTGNGLANKITGNAAKNVLSGLGGNDLLDGGGGADSLIGGAGNDSYVIKATGVTITELAGQGNADTVLSSISYSLGAQIENLLLTGAGAINGTGNAANNVISGNNAANTLNGSAGNDILDGGLGNDVLIGGAGADDLTGGGGIDTASYASDTIGITVSLATGIGRGGQAEGDSLTTIANLTGGSGKDTLEGDAGNNILDGGSGLDTVSYEHAAAVSVNLTVTTAQNTGAAGIDTIRNFENLTGSAGNDLLIGSSAINVITGLDGDDRINGGAGNDRMVGGAGNDTYYVSDAGDVVIEAAGQGSADIVFASITTHMLAAEVENLTLTGSAVSGVGNQLNNTIIGTSSSNGLSGGLGNDILDAGLGNDSLNGNAGNDTLTGGGGNDLFKFLDFFGRDTVTDFTRGQDDIYISKSVFSSWSDILAHTADDGLGNTIISLDADHTIVLLDVLRSSLQSSDFSLV